MRRCLLRVSDADAGQPLWEFLSNQLPCSVEQAQQLVRTGAVYLNGRRCLQADTMLANGQVVTAVLEESGRPALEPNAERPRPTVLFEDSQVVAVNKPPGLNAQPSPGRVGESLLDWVSSHLGRPAGLVHRLDRDTSGVTVFGKTAEATSKLAGQFREGLAQKQYLAVTGPGLPERGAVESPIAKDPSRPGRYRALSGGHGKPALTHYERLYGDERFCLVSLLPQTGRTHQLRVHLSSLGTPILGDRLYGGAMQAGEWGAPRCLLHAYRLTLAHLRTGKPLALRAPLPEDMQPFFTRASVVPE